MAKTNIVACFLVLFGLLMGMRRTVMAQAAPAYPGKPIRIVSPFPPGACTDFYDKKKWGQTTVSG